MVLVILLVKMVACIMHEFVTFAFMLLLIDCYLWLCLVLFAFIKDLTYTFRFVNCFILEEILLLHILWAVTA